MIKVDSSIFFTCIALSKAGIEMGPLRLSVLTSVHPSATLLVCLVCVICNSKSLYSLIFTLCIIIVHTLKMCTSYCVINIFSFLTVFFPSEMLRGCLVSNSSSFHSFPFKVYIMIVHTLKMCTLYFVHLW